MNVFDDYTRQLLAELNNNKVEYLVIGGYAVNFHGYRRTTGDIDIWIKPDNEINKQKLLECLKNLNVSPEKISILNEWNFSKPIVFIDGEEPFKIDFMTHVTGVKFDEAFNQKVTTVLDEIEIPLINYEHLIVAKFFAARPQDKIDIEMLQKIHALKNKK